MSEDTKMSLLLIEVDQLALEICSDIIKKNFPELIVHTASNPDKALFLFNDQKHDIVISDVFYPGEDGIKIAREICAEKPDTLVLFISADPSLNKQVIEPYAKELCLKRIINKPLDIKELIKSITAAIAIVKDRVKTESYERVGKITLLPVITTE